MNATTLIQPHALLSKRSESNSHNINAGKGSGPSSAFSDYLFGPLSSGSGGPNGAPKASIALSQARNAIEGRT